MNTELLMIRHGQSQGNAGLSLDPDCSLTPLGQEQSYAAGQLVAAHGLAGFVALVSPYRRARETAAQITRATGIPFAVEALIREWQFSGPATVQAAVYPLESLESLVDRLQEFLRRYHGQRLLIVSHAGPIAVLTQLAWGERPDPHAAVENGVPRWLKVTHPRCALPRGDIPDARWPADI